MTHLCGVLDGCVGDLLAGRTLPAAQVGLVAGGGRRRRLLGVGQGRSKDQAKAEALRVKSGVSRWESASNLGKVKFIRNSRIR